MHLILPGSLSFSYLYHTNLLLFLALRNVYSPHCTRTAQLHIHSVGLACYGQISRLLVRAPTPDNNFALCPIDWNGGSAGGENLFLLIFTFFSFSAD